MSANATYESCRVVSAIAGEDLTGDLYKFCKFSSGQAVVCDTAQEIADGIVAEEVDAAGKVFPMLVPDGCFAPVLVGTGGVAQDALVATAADGRAITAGTTAGNTAMGKAMEAGAAGEVITIHFILKRTAAGA